MFTFVHLLLWPRNRFYNFSHIFNLCNFTNGFCKFGSDCRLHMCPKPVLFRPSCIQLTWISIAVASGVVFIEKETSEEVETISEEEEEEEREGDETTSSIGGGKWGRGGDKGRSRTGPRRLVVGREYSSGGGGDFKIFPNSCTGVIWVRGYVTALSLVFFRHFS